MMAVTPVNACTSSRDSPYVGRANGPNPASVPAMATPDRTSTAVAASRGSNRNAAQSSSGTHRNSSG